MLDIGRLTSAFGVQLPIRQTFRKILLLGNNKEKFSPKLSAFNCAFGFSDFHKPQKLNSFFFFKERPTYLTLL